MVFVSVACLVCIPEDIVYIATAVSPAPETFSGFYRLGEARQQQWHRWVLVRPSSVSTLDILVVVLFVSYLKGGTV